MSVNPISFQCEDCLVVADSQKDFPHAEGCKEVSRLRRQKHAAEMATFLEECLPVGVCRATNWPGYLSLASRIVERVYNSKWEIK